MTIIVSHQPGRLTVERDTRTGDAGQFLGSMNPFGSRPCGVDLTIIVGHQPAAD